MPVKLDTDVSVQVRVCVSVCVCVCVCDGLEAGWKLNKGGVDSADQPRRGSASS